MDIEKRHNTLIDKTINAHLKHLGLKLNAISNEFWIYKGEIALVTDLISKREVFIWLEGYSASYDNGSD